jgi:hypothetical protein
VLRVILAAYHAKMTELQQQAAEETPIVSDSPPAVATVLDEFTGWLKVRVQEGRKAGSTPAWYTDYLNSFLAYLRTIEPGQPQVPTIIVDQLQPLHVYRWVDAHPHWKSGKRGAMVAVQGAFNWEAKGGLLKAIGGNSPLAGLEKPQQGRREQFVTPDEFEDILSWVKDRPFTDLLETSWDTGARPTADGRVPRGAALPQLGGIAVVRLFRPGIDVQHILHRRHKAGVRLGR